MAFGAVDDGAVRTTVPATPGRAGAEARAAGPGLRLAASFATTVVGLVALAPVPPRIAPDWAAWVGVGLIGGLIAGRLRDAWVGGAAVVVFLVLAAARVAIDDSRPFWLVGTAFGVLAVAGGLVVGAGLGVARGPRPLLSTWWAGLGRWRRPTLIVMLAPVIAGIGLAGYGFTAGADEYLSGLPRDPGCATPLTRFGWTYEPINYEPADDERLVADNANLAACATQGSPAGGAVITSDGVAIAGWYVPAERGIGPTGPTVVLVHGGKTNKSGMLEYAPGLHADYNLVFVDLRNSGRSGAARSTGGLHERRDLRAMLDWLEQTKSPAWVAVVGNSNGGATALAEAVDDPRVRALVLDSMHASIEAQIGNVAETERGLPAWPGVAALVAGVSLRLGEDIAEADPVVSIRRLAARPIPILFTHGGRDVVDRPGDSLEINLRAAIEAGLPVEARVCPEAGHGKVITVCAEEWGTWVRDFLAAARPTIGG